jgi:hypothetical protein
MHLRDELPGVGHVLEHLRAKEVIEALVGQRDRLPIEVNGVAVVVAEPVRVLYVDTDIAGVRPGNQVLVWALAATDVEHRSFQCRQHFAEPLIDGANLKICKEACLELQLVEERIGGRVAERLQSFFLARPFRRHEESLHREMLEIWHGS